MRIGVNALYLIPGGVGGTEIYLRNLLCALAAIDSENEYFIFTNRETGTDVVPQQPNFHHIPQPIRAEFRPARILWEQTSLPWTALRYRLNLLFNPGYTAPLLSPCPNVTTFHDMQHKRHPEYFRWFDLPFWNLFLWASAHRSRQILTVSEATRSDLRRFYGLDSVVTHLGVEPAFFEIATRREPREYVLCVSTLHPHKNLDRLLRVHAQQPDLPRLVVTGLRGFATKQIEQAAGPNVEFTGWIPREQLYELFRHARGFVYPSRFEGFGLPVLEAMAAGVPIACSDIPSLREIAGDCVFFFHPENEGEIAAALKRVVRDTSLVERARQRAQTFTWERTARLTLSCLMRASRPPEL